MAKCMKDAASKRLYTLCMFSLIPMSFPPPTFDIGMRLLHIMGYMLFRIWVGVAFFSFILI